MTALYGPNHCKKYRDPLDVITTSPGFTLPFAIGLVVMFSPSANARDPLMNPVIDLSLFCFQRAIEGTPLGALRAIGDLLSLARGTFVSVFSLFAESSASLSNPKNADRENVARGGAFSAASGGLAR